MRNLKPIKGLKDLYPGLLNLVSKKSMTKAGGQRAKGKIDRSSRSLAASSVISEFLMVGVLIIFSIIVFAYLSGDMSTGTSDLQQSANNLNQQLDAVLTGPTVDPLSGSGGGNNVGGSGSGQIGALNEVNTPSTDGSGSGGTVQPMATGPVTTLSGAVTTSAVNSILYTWTIDKTVTPNHWDLFTGDTGTSQYTVTVNKDSGESQSGISGVVTVTNGGAGATQNLKISVYLTQPPSTTPMGTVNVDLGDHSVLAPGESYSYPYTFTVNGLASGYKVTADITITNHAGHVGDEFGPSPSAGGNVPTSQTKINDQINVDDTNGQSWTFSSSGSQTYTKTFNAAGTFDNTATIRETGASDTATVTVNVYDLAVSKDAQTSVTRTYGWTIDKSVTPAVWNLFSGDSGTSQYTVAVTKDAGIDSDRAVSGTITVHNPAPIAATINSVSDVVSSDIDASVVAGVTFPYTLAAGGDLTLPYSADLPDASGRTNTATAVLQNYAYSYTGSPVASGTSPFSGTASVSFADPTVNEVNDQVHVSDTNGGAGWDFSDSGSVTYTKTFSAAGTFPNTATIDETGQSDSASVTVNVFSLAVSKTAQASLTRTYVWTIDKSVTPAVWNLFDGDTATSQYTVAVTKDAGTDSNRAVSGTITVHNPAPIAATINSVSDIVSSGIAANVDITDVTFPYTLAAGGDLILPYSADLPNTDSRTNTATAVLQNYAYSYTGSPVASGTSPFAGSADVSFTAPTVTKVNDQVHVTDTNGQSWTFSDDGSVSYDETFVAPADEGTHTNTAIITETGQSDDALVTVNVYSLGVSKTAQTSLTRTYTWTIDKSVTPAVWNLFSGDSGTSQYTVAVTKDAGTDSDRAVSGTITVHNPAPIAATINSVSDIVDPAIAGSVNFGVSFPYTLAAGGTLTGTYTASLPDSTGRTNTATATLQNHAYTASGSTPSGTTDFSGTASVSFASPTITEVNPTIHVTDTNGGSWTFSDDGSVSYDETFVAPADEGTYTNTATIEETEQSDSALVTVNVYSLAVSKDAQASLTRTYGWAIDKSVTPDEWDLFTGDSGISDYTVSVTRDEGTDSAWGVAGSITVHNPAPIAATINSVSDVVSSDIDASVVAGVTFPYTLAAGGDLTLTYSADLPDASGRTNTATATLQNHDYDSRLVATDSGTTDFSGSAAVNFDGATVNEVNDEIDVDDSNGQSWHFTGSDSESYSVKFTAADVGDNPNTATIRGTTESASTNVHVNVYDLSVAKTASTSYTRTYEWGISKSVTPDVWNLFTGDSGTSDYTVSVTKTGYEDSAALVSGTITITNPAPIDAPIASVTDLFSSPVTITEAIPTEIPAGQSVTLHYTASPSTTAGGVNTATVELQNYDYDSSNVGTATGTQEYSATANVVFGAPTHEVNDEVHVVDSVQGALGTASADQTWTYSRTFTSDDEGVHGNTASITETGDSASASVTVNVYDPYIENDPVGTYERVYTWTIEKSADQDEMTLQKGQIAVANYVVTVDADFEDGNYALDGYILVTNNAPISLTINNIAVVISPTPESMTLEPSSYPITLDSGESIQLDYTATLSSIGTYTSTSTVVVQLYDYDSSGEATPGDTREITSSPVTIDANSFSMTEEVDESITVTDTLQGYLGDATYGTDELPKSFSYPRNIGPYDEAGEYTVDNIATFTTCDTETPGSDDWEVIVHVPDAGKITGYKFYDTNYNGDWDAGEPAIQGWKINLTSLTDPTFVTPDVYTNDKGAYTFEKLPAGTYLVKEIFPTTPHYVGTTVTSYTVTLAAGGYKECNFGNVALTEGIGGFTIGYWGNKNGQRIITADDLAFLKTLNLHNAGAVYPPFTDKVQIKSYLRDANAVDMRYMLSAQLIATELNVRHGHGYITENTVIYVGPSDGFMTVGDVLSSSLDALHTGDRSAQGYWKDILDGINNNNYEFLSNVPLAPNYT